MEKGKLIAFNGSGKPLELQEFAIPSLKPGEILVKNRYTTLCGSDIHTYCGHRKEACPTVLGHEIVGEIVEIEAEHPGRDYNGEVLSPGDLITWSIFSSNPGSELARQGIPQKSDQLFKYGHALITDDDPFHGGLAEYCILRRNTGVLKVPGTLPLPVAATLNCSLATVAGALRLAGAVEGKNVLILGMGMLGVSCAAMCHRRGASWIGATDVSETRLKESTRFGVNEGLNLDKSDAGAIEQLRNRFVRKGVDIVFDMSGAPGAMELGLEVLGIGGTAVWVGAVFHSRKVQVDAEQLIRNLRTIKGLHNYNFDDFNDAMQFLKESWRSYPFDKVVETEFDLDHVQEAFEYAMAHKPLRVGIKIG